MRLIGAPLKNEGMDCLPPATLPRAWVSKINKGEASKDPIKSFDVGRRRINLGRMLTDDKESMGDKHKRDGNLSIGSEREGVGES